MTSIRIALLALVLSVSALAVLLMRPATSSRAAELALDRGEGALAVDEQLRRLAQRIDQLDVTLEALQLRPASGDAGVRQPAVLNVAPDAEWEAPLSSLDKRVSQLEQARESMLWDARADNNARREFEAALRAGRKDEDDEKKRLSVDEWALVCRDPNQTTEERLKALGQLRRRRQADGTEARLLVLPDMLQLAQLSDQGHVRADVWRQMDGVTDPALREALLQALAGDTYADSREEAAESLAEFLPDAGVESALRYAQQNDEDSGVRRQAEKSLEKPRR